ncbi:MAG TPA: 30S ribosomal protein S3 [bacterium]
MGQKINPIGIRVGITRDWDSIWFSAKQRNYTQTLLEDIEIRKFVKLGLKHAGIARVVLKRKGETVEVDIFASRPGIVIGKKGSEVDKLKEQLQKLSKKEIRINIIEEKHPETNAQLIAEGVANQLEKRVAFRRAMKKAIQAALDGGAKGIKIMCSGRLAGSEIARSEWYREGRVPLHTLRADIDYGLAVSNTTYGTIGVKCWVFKREIFGSKDKQQEEVVVAKPKAAPRERQAPDTRKTQVKG